MKPIVLQNWESIKVTLAETINSSWVDIVVAYADSWTSLSELSAYLNLTSTTDTTLLSNWWSNKYVVADISFTNTDNIDHTVLIKVDNWSSVYRIWKLIIPAGYTATLDDIWLTTSSTWSWEWGSWWLSITPVAKYDWSLVEWVFEEIQLPSDTTINNIKAVLEWAPSGSDDNNDDTELKIEYTTDWGSTWTVIATINFDADDTKTNWVLIKNVNVWANHTENTRIRFNITKTADNYAGDNLKVYFK